MVERLRSTRPRLGVVKQTACNKIVEGIIITAQPLPQAGFLMVVHSDFFATDGEIACAMGCVDVFTNLAGASKIHLSQ